LWLEGYFKLQIEVQRFIITRDCGCIDCLARILIFVKMKKSHIIATTYLVIIQRFCLGDYKFDCEEDRPNDKDFAANVKCQEEPGDFPATLEIQYKGDNDELKDECALGEYRFVAITKKDNSPVYVQKDEEHENCNKASRSFIFLDWDDGTWIGTRSFEKDKKRDEDENLWLKSVCKKVSISNCKEEDWEIQTTDPETQNSDWKKNSVSLIFNPGVSMASIIGIVVGVVVLIAIIAIVAVLVVKKKRKNGHNPKHTVGGPV